MSSTKDSSEVISIFQFGNGAEDHSNWQRPEDMDPNRPAYKIDASNPGSELAAETAAALAAASMVYTQMGDTDAASDALEHARELFNFADNYRGTYSSSIPDAANFYK